MDSKNWQNAVPGGQDMGFRVGLDKSALREDQGKRICDPNGSTECGGRGKKNLRQQWVTTTKTKKKRRARNCFHRIHG